MTHPEQPTPAALFTQMSALAYERSEEFRRGAQDRFKLTIDTEIDTEEQALDDLGNLTPLYDKKVVSFTAERTEAPIRRNKVPLPTAFDISCSDQAYIRALPGAVLPFLDSDTREGYAICNPGDLQQVQGVHYRIENDGGDIDITRNITYALHGPYGPIYVVGETDEPQDKVLWIPVAHEHQSLRIEQRVTEEQAEDQIEQFFYNEKFDDFRDGAANANFYNEFAYLRDQDATICISALLRCLTHGKRIPRFDELINLAP